ncbi:MAG: branched-chain amino acid ABC transporter permease [Candidatus Pacebacteria bacterium]|nr:branched-chain amino acid ABC transporter permease [Candidatus Paceibacterota bacterium]
MEQVIANGLFSGTQYALIALGLTLIFGLMNVLNFAHGQMFVLGALFAYTIFNHIVELGWFLGMTPWLGNILTFMVALVCSLVFLAFVGALFERFLFRTVIKRSSRDESTMLLAAATAFLLDSLLPMKHVFGELSHSLPALVEGSLTIEQPWFSDSPFSMPLAKVFIFSLALFLIAGFMAFMQYTKPGRAMRALAQDKIAAQLMGVHVDRFTMLGFALGAMLAGGIGALMITITNIGPTAGSSFSIKAFIMVMIGGAGVVGGAIAGGFVLGMMESIVPTLLAPYDLANLSDLIIFAALMIFLSFRPQGLMGKPWG